RPDWAMADRSLTEAERDAAVALTLNGKSLACFALDDQLRPGAAEAVAQLKGFGAFVEILSGDRDSRVQKIARQLGLTWTAEARPADKIRRVEAFRQAGNKVLM